MLVAVLFLVGTAANKARPHIVMILADDFSHANLGVNRRASDAGPQALAEIMTPTLDALANDGILLRHHMAYKICGPSRSSLLSGRLAVHVNNVNTAPSAFNPKDPVSGYAGIPRNMTTIGTKMRQAGYKTAFYGKWDVGMATVDHTPPGRGFQDSLYFYHHANNYYDCGVELEATGEINVCLNHFTDLSESNASGVPTGYAGLAALRAEAASRGDDEASYVENLFRARALRTIAAHDPSESPLFLFHSFHLLHTPMQVPFRYLELADARVAGAGGSAFDSQNRRLYAAMTLYMDEVVGQLVAALKANRNMWADTLLVFMSDNGGPVYYPGASSNYPLKGGKYSDWDGGVRTAAFIAGGAVPVANRGTSFDGIVSIADWYATFCEIAGVDPTDHSAVRANVWLEQQGLPLLPPIDSVPQWQHVLRGRNGRTGLLHLSEHAVLRWPFKLVTGKQPYSAWTGELFPNCSTHASLLDGHGPLAADVRMFGESVRMAATEAENHRVTWTQDCGDAGCLVNLEQDPTEHVDLGPDPAHATLRKELRQALAELNRGIFSPDRGPDSVATCAAALHNGGFYGPFVEFEASAWDTVRQRDDSALPLSARVSLATYRYLSTMHDQLVEVYQMLMPTFVPVIVRKWEVCRPDPSTAGTRPGAFKLDRMFVPLILIYAFWVQIVFVGLGTWLIYRLYRRCYEYE